MQNVRLYDIGLLSVIMRQTECFKSSNITARRTALTLWPYIFMQVSATTLAWPGRAPTHLACAHLTEVQELQKVLRAVSLAEVYCDSSCLDAIAGLLG